MRQLLLKVIRSKMLQPFWSKLNHISLIGMNYYGGASLLSSGELQTLNYIKKKLENKNQFVIFDVGANTGEYSLNANRIFNENAIIYAFEPSSFTFDQLIKRVNNNPKIITHKLGMGDKDSSLQLYSSGQGSTTSSVYNLRFLKKEFSEDFTETIEITTIDSFCRINEVKFIDLLKIDIEGHELLALKGAESLIDTLSVNFIQFEFGKCDIDARVFFRDFFEILSPNFNLYRIVSDGLFAIEKYDSSLEIFQTANFLAERKNLKPEH